MPIQSIDVFRKRIRWLLFLLYRMASKMKWTNEKDVALIREMSQERPREKKWCHQQKVVIDKEQGTYKPGTPTKLAFILEICMNPKE